jgi:hypothetical protein
MANRVRESGTVVAVVRNLMIERPYFQVQSREPTLEIDPSSW